MASFFTTTTIITHWQHPHLLTHLRNNHAGTPAFPFEGKEEEEVMKSDE